MLRRTDPLRAGAILFLSAYALFLVVITQFLFHADAPPANFVPFRGIVRDCTVGSTRDFVVNFLGNILAFVPIGLLLPIAIARGGGFRRTTALCAGFSLAIEAGQYLSGRRTADVDDLLLNALGGAVGYVVYRLIRRLRTPASNEKPDPRPL